MDTRAILADQMEQLEQRLCRIEAAIQGGAAIEKTLLERVRVRFEGRIGEQRRDLENARILLRDPQADLADCWDAFRPVRDACRPLFEEALAVLEGALARSAGLDDGLCGAADALIAEIGKYAERDWQRFTVLDEGELYSTVADVIRLRFPSAGIWDLPIAAHEFGHFASRQVVERDRAGRSRDAFQDFLDANHADPGAELWAHLNEHFADLFATYACGPAYARSALLLRFDPSRPDRESDGAHPSFAKRAYLILGALERMDHEENDRPYAGIVKALRGIWSPPDAAARIRIDGYVEDLYPMLNRNFPQVRYKTWARAGMLAAKLAAAPRMEASLRDVLNAAWLCRMRNPERQAGIEQAAAAWFREANQGVLA